MRYSQGCQDEILKTIFDRIGTTNKLCVEFGFDSTELTGGNGANTARLILEDGWKGLLLDRDRQNLLINLHQITLTPENLSSVLAFHNVPREVDYVSIDVDSIDLWLFRALLQSGYRPRAVSVEYNANYRLEESVTMRPGQTWQNGDQCYGASLLALHRVAARFGYNLVDVAPQMDAFFVRGDLSEPVPLEKFERFTQIPTHAVPTLRRVAEAMVEYL